MSRMLDEMRARNARSNPAVCIALVEGCEACAADPRSTNHTECDDLCGLYRDGNRDPEEHALSHEPVTCDGCGHVLDDRRGNRSEKHARCASGCCREVRCLACDEVWMSDGPIGCPSCSGGEVSR